MNSSLEKNKELISVIIPVYNCEKTLERCIRSIQMQTYKNLEIFFVDDGSIDDSGKVICKYAEKDDRIVYYKQDNSGVSSARNKGLDMSRGTYLAFVDADDYVDERYIENLYIALKKNDADISVCYLNDEPVDETNATQIDINENSRVNCFTIEKGFCYLKHGFSHWVSCGALYKKQVINDIRFDKDICVAEDSLFFAKVAQNSKRIVHTNQYLYHYIIYKKSAAHGEFDLKKYSELEAWRRICDLFREYRPLYYSAKAAYAIRCRYMILKYYNNEMFKENYYDFVKKEYMINQKYFFMVPGRHMKECVKNVLFIVAPRVYIKLYEKRHVKP